MAATYDLGRLRHDLAADIDAYLLFAGTYGDTGSLLGQRFSALLTPSVTACFLYRVSHWLYAKKWGRLAFAMAWCNCLVTRASICPASEIGGGLYIPHPVCVVFQGHAGRNLRLFSGAGATEVPPTPLHRHPLRGFPTLGDDVMLGSKALVTGPVRVGSGCRIGINAVVRRDVPAGASVLAVRRRSPIRQQARSRQA